MTLGERLKELRLGTGFSQEQVAERVGVSRQAVTKWETGQTIPAAENLAALAELYQVSLDDLGEDRSARVRASSMPGSGRWPACWRGNGRPQKMFCLFWGTESFWSCAPCGRCGTCPLSLI